MAPLVFRVNAKNKREAKSKARKIYKNKKHKISKSLDFNVEKFTEDFYVDELL